MKHKMQIDTIIKAEEAAMLTATYILSLVMGYNWWVFIVLLLVPDISMLGYAFGNKAGAWIYNLFHFKALAVVVALTGLYLNSDVTVLAGLILFGHSSMDRMLGYGLKYYTGFGHTHLGTIGKDS